jgi:outer membrane protein assembly factor BamD
LKKIHYLFLSLVTILVFNACSAKQEEEYNKPALYWYNKMLSQIASYQLDQADETYTSLESEHRYSPLLPSATMLIANAHMEDEEYELATYYYDEYLKRFDNGSQNAYIKYLKIKAKFLAFKQQFREQNLITETLNEIDIYLKEFPNSSYKYLAQNMRSRLLMAQATLDLEIADLYERKEKQKAAELYKQRAQNSWTETKTIEPVNVPWYRAIFE